VRRHVLRGRRPQVLVAGVAALSLIGFALPNDPAGAVLQQAVPPTLSSSTQFDVTGFLQDATLDQACVAAAGSLLDAQGNPQVAHCGGTATINGHVITIPAETIVILPAAALTWQELFAKSPAPYTGSYTGMALADKPTPPYTTYEVQVVGNRVIQGGKDRMIAGLVHVSQQDLNGGVGYINYIDYAKGELEVGGVIGQQGTGARVAINDPYVDTNDNGVQDPGETGRYGRANSPDVRFQVDQDNPTILAETGFPMCIPRVTVDPNLGGADDPLCPRTNRPISTGVTDALGAHPPAGQFDTLFRMNVPGSPSLDPTIEAPFEIGDFVNFSGTLIADGTPNGYISAHTIVASLGVYTQPGIDPAFVTVDVSLLGTGGLTIFGAGEAVVRTRFEGMSTDETRTIHVYGVDMDPATGATSDRDFGTIVPDPGPPGGAVRGRWRLRPPCTVNVPTQKNCTPPASGNYLPPPREVRAVLEGLQQFNADGTANPASQVPGTANAQTTTNGIYYGQYHAPVGEYIFPENVPGSPVPENNFNTMDFLAYGGYTSVTGVLAGVLNPWPSNVPPPARVCPTPTIVGGPYSVATGGTVNLSATVNADATSPVRLQWNAGTTLGGTDLTGRLTNATTTAPTFNAAGLGAVPTVYLTLTATNVCGPATATAVINVVAAPVPTINPITNQSVNVNTQVVITASSVSAPAPKWAWTPGVNPSNPAITQTPVAATAASTSSIRFTPTVAGTYTFKVVATNANGSSQPTTVTITVLPAAVNNITFTAEFRTGKQRLVITALTTDLTVGSMVLKPYMTESGTMFDPATLGAAQLTNGGGGNWTLTVVGAPPPACRLGGAYATPCSKTPLQLTSTGGNAGAGTSTPTALTKIRA
jgi:hypothetical protein